MSDESSAGVQLRLTPADVLLLGAGAAFWPLRVLAANAYLIAHPERLILMIFVVWLLAFVIAWVLIRLGLGRQLAVGATFLGTVLFMTGGRLLALLGEPIGWLLLPAIAVLLWFVLYRLEGSQFLTPLMVAVAIALLSGPAVVLYEQLSDDGESNVVVGERFDVRMEETPDIFLVVFDGYPGLVTLRNDFATGKDRLTSGLQARGFEIPSSSWSSYPRTHFSLASVVEMSYPVEQLSEGRRTVAELYDIISGQSALVDVLRSNGYEISLVESGWGGLSCDDFAVDDCVVSPFFSEETYVALRDTVTRPLVLSTYGHAFTVGSQNTMEWLLDNASGIASDGKPSFVMAHVMAPHPPYHLDENCQTIGERSVEGSASNAQVAELEAGFDQQMRCVDEFMMSLADEVDAEDVLLYVADHGSNTRGQTPDPGDSWSRDEIAERLNIFAAFRTPDTCEMGDPFVLPNLFRRLLDCHSDSSIGDLEARMFLPAGFEVDPQAVQELLE